MRFCASRNSCSLTLGSGARDLAPTPHDPLVDGLRIQSELPAAFCHRVACRDDVVGALAPEFVGVLGGWVGHVCRLFVVVGMHSKGMVPLACVSERTIQVSPLPSGFVV